MQLPLSASALVILGVGAVLVGAVILVVEIARRRKSASGPTRVPPDMRMSQPPATTSGPYAAAPPAPAPPVPAPPVAPVAQPHVPAAEPVPVPVEREPGPAAPPAPQPLAGPAAPRPLEVSSRVEPPGSDEQVPPPWTPAAGMPAVPSRHHQAGSGRTVAAAVAQAFAVRAAASRAGASGRRPVDPPRFDERAAAAPEPEHAEQVPAESVDDVDPAATTDPEGVGLAAMATPGSDEPQPEASGDGCAAPVAHGVNGDRPAEAPEQAPGENGRPPEGQAGVGEAGPAAVVGAGVLAAGWTVPAAPVQADPAPAEVPAPRSDDDDADAQQDEPVRDARDRLLAVLLDDPERAVGAADELESRLRELDRLSDAVRTGRAALREVLQRLSAAGLRPDQMARLARMPLAEVEALLEPTPAEQQA